MGTMIRRTLAAIVSLFFVFTSPAAAVATAPLEIPDANEDALDGATPCLNGDPYNLPALRTVTSGDVPPSSPVTINAHIVVTYMGTGAFITDTVDEVPPDSSETGNPAPIEPEVADTH